MKKLIKKLSSCVLPGDQLLPLVEAHAIKKQKKCDLPWVEVVKRLLTRAVDEDNGVLFENTTTIIRVHLNETVRKGLKNPSQLGQKYYDILNSLLTHLHLTMEDTNLQVVEMHTLSSLILAAVIDMSIAAYKKGEEASLLPTIFMKLTMFFGHSQELLLDALLHCKTLIHPRSRQPSVQVPLIKRLFSSIRCGQTMAPVLYLKYLLLGKLWLFMTEKKELRKTRMYIVKVLKLPESVRDWAVEKRVPWLGLSKWSTRLVLKNMTLLGALQTFYGDWYKEIKAGDNYQVKREKTPKGGLSKSCTNKTMTGKVQTKDHEEFHRPPFSEMSDDDVKLELELVNIVSDVTDEEPLQCSSKNNENNKNQKKKRKFKEVITPKGKKRKVQDCVDEENELPAASKSVSLMKTKSGLCKSSNKNVYGQKKKDNTSYKITENSPEVPILLTDSVESMKKETQLVDINSHVADVGSPFGNKSVMKKRKRKTLDALQQKAKKAKAQEYNEDKEVNAALTNKAKKKQIKKKSKKTAKTMAESPNSNNEEHTDQNKDVSDVLLNTEHSLEDSSFIHLVEGKLETLEKATKKKSSKIPKFTLMDKKNLRDETRKSICLFEVSGDAPSLETSNKPQGRKSSRKQKLSRKQKRIRRKILTFTVTDLEEERDSFAAEEAKNNNNICTEELSKNADNEIKALNVMPAEEQVMNIENKANFVSHEEITSYDTEFLKFLRVPSVNATADGNSSEDSSDYDRSDGDEDNNLEHSKIEIELKNSTKCKKEENFTKRSGTKHQAIHKDDSDESKSTSEYADETGKGTLVVASSKVPETLQNDISKGHQNDSFMTESDADVSSEETPLDSEDTEGKAAIDDVNGNENRDGEIVLESGSDDMKNDCDSILSTNDTSNVSTKDDEILSDASKQLEKESYGYTEKYENLSDEESNSEGEIIITKYIAQNPENKNIKIDNIEEEAITSTTISQDEDSKDTLLIVDDIKEIEYCGHHNRGKEDSKTSNSFNDITVLETGCDTKIMESISRTSDVSVNNVRDNENAVLKSPESDQAIASCKESSEVSISEDTKNYIELKESEVIEVEDLLEEVKQEPEIKTSSIKISPIKMSPVKTSPIKASLTSVKDSNIMAETSSVTMSPADTEDASTIPPMHHCRSSKLSKDVMQDPVSRMMNNLYKSNTVKIENSEKEESNHKNQNSDLLNGHENPISDDDKSVIVDEDKEIENMLQNIVKDTGRPSSIHGLRERFLSESSVKDEQKENPDHDQDDKEPIMNSEMAPCTSQIKISDSISHPLLETTEATSSKSVTLTENQEDTDSLIDTIVKDESRLAEIRELRETLFCKASVLDESMEISKCDEDGKEATRDNFNNQIKRDKDCPQNFHLFDEALPSNNTMSSDTIKKNKDLKDTSRTFHVDKHLATGNASSIPNDNEPKSTDDSRREITRDKDQETSDNKHCQKPKHNNVQNDEFMNIISYTAGRGNDSASSKPLNAGSVETNEQEELSDIDTSTDDSHSLVLKLSNSEERESVMDETKDKCIGGGDEAYEASSDASEPPPPRTRRRSRSLRKSFTQQEVQMASDSDSSPVRVFGQRGSVIDVAGHERSKRRRSQSCSFESLSSALHTQNKSKTLEKSVNKTFTIEKEYTFNETFTMIDKDTSHLEASMPKDISISYNEKNAHAASNESKQDVLAAESNKASIVKSTKSTPHPSTKIDVTETTETDTMESSSSAPSQSLQNKEQLHELTLAKKSIFPSDTELKEPPNKSSIPCKPNSNASQIELSGHSKDEVPSKIMEDTTTDPNKLPNKGETTSFKRHVLSDKTFKSQDCEVLIKVQNSLSEKKNQISSDVNKIKDLENQEIDQAGSAEDIENETEHEIRDHAEALQVTEDETQREEIKNAESSQNFENQNDEGIEQKVDQLQNHIDNELNQEIAEGIYEGEEVEVLSTSGIEEDEKETVGKTPETFGNKDVKARRADLLISKKSLRSHIRQLHMTKDGKDVSSDTGRKDSRLGHIPVGKAQCLSQVVLTKEVLISPDVSDEECELVSPGVDLSDAKIPIEGDTLDDSISQKDVPLCFSNLNLQKSNGGINSPHKTIPEEQDETTIPKSSSDHCPEAPTLQGRETLTIPSSVSVPDTEKPDNRKIRTRRSSQGVAAECVSWSSQTLEVSKPSKSHIKSPNTISIIQKDHESSPDTPDKFAIQNAVLKRTKCPADISKEAKSLADSHDSVSASSLCIDKVSKDKKLQTSSPSSGGSQEKELNTSRSISQERILLSSQNQNSELLFEDSNDVHKPERCKITKLHLAKNSSAGASEDTVLKADEGNRKSHLLPSVIEESSDCDTPCSNEKAHTCLPSSISLSPTSSTQLPVRRSSRLRNQCSVAFPVTKNTRSRKTERSRSSAHSESEQEIEDENSDTPGSLKNLRRMRNSTTPRKAQSEATFSSE